MPVGTYKNVTYKAWSPNNVIGSTVPVLVGGVAPQSPPNRILTNAANQLTQGSIPTFMPADPFQKISVYDFYFGCQVFSGQPAVAVATKCTISVKGFAVKTNQQVASAFFTFTPPFEPVTPVAMKQAILGSGFSQPLGMVTVEVVDDAAVKNMYVDDPSYSVST